MSKQILFEENIKRFSVFSEEEAKLIPFSESASVTFCTNENGEENLKIIKENGEEDYLYSRESVKNEAYNWFSALRLANVKILYIYGIGLGSYYTACKEWLRKDPSRFIIFLEDDKEIIGRFFQTDLATEILHDRQVRIHCLFARPIYEDPIIDHLTTAFIFDPYQFAALKFYQKTRSDFVNELKRTFSHLIYSKQSRMGEFLTGSGHFFKNYYNNLKFLPESYYGNALFNQFQNVPAIICGAGPSLEKNIHLLKTLKDKALIISGGSATNALNAYDIFPHFTVGIDPNPSQLTRILSNTAYETPFFYRNRIYTEALTVHSAPKLYLTGTGGYDIPEWIEKKLGIESGNELLDEGYNVINFSVSIAKKLGCNPIILCGLDLAYTDNRSYIPGMKFHALHNFKKTYITKGPQDELIGFKDIYGNSTTTLWKWINEASWFTYFSAMNPKTMLINATEGGIGFPNIKNMTLSDVSNQYLINQYDFENKIHGEIENSRFSKSIDKAKILKIMKLLRKSLGSTEVHLKSLTDKCAKLIKMRLEDKDSEIEPYLKDLTEAENQFRNEDYFKYVLKQFTNNYFAIFEKRMPYFLYDLDQNRKDAKILSRIELELDCDRFLKSVIQLNKNILEDAIHAYPLVLKSKKKKKPSLNEFKVEIDNDLEKKTTYYPNHALKTEEHFKNGLREGASIYYGSHGVILANSCYEKGLRSGKAYFFYATGELFAVKNFNLGLADGLQEYYYEDGSKKLQITYSLGKLDGDVILYHKNKTLKRKLHFKNGKRIGLEFMWNEKGVAIIEASYVDDKPVGTALWRYDNGILKQKVTYHENFEDYEIQCYAENGREILKEIVEEEDYFDKLIKITNTFMESIEDIFKKADVIIPLLEGEDAENIRETKNQLEVLRDEIKALSDINRNIKDTFRGNAHQLEEPIWKSSALQAKIEEQLNGLMDVMKKEITEMQQLIQKAIDKAI